MAILPDYWAVTNSSNVGSVVTTMQGQAADTQLRNGGPATIGGVQYWLAGPGGPYPSKNQAAAALGHLIGYGGEKLRAGATEAQVLAYLGAFGGTVTAAWVTRNPSLKPLEGNTAPEVYQALKTANPKATPYRLASAITAIWAGSGLASGIADLVNNVGAATAASAAGTVAGLNQFANAVPAITNPLSGLDAFFGTLGDASLWIRVGEVLLGLILLGVGAARITHVQNPVSMAVKAVI